MNNFREIRNNFVEKLAYKRREYIILIKIITGYVVIGHLKWDL